MRLQVSGDDGRTWKPAAVLATGKGRYKAVFRTPAGTTVSRKAQAIDAEGNSTEITTIAAYALG